MKHWIGALCIAAACALVGLVIPDSTETGEAIGGGLLAIGLLVGVIALFKIGADLMRADRQGG